MLRILAVSLWVIAAVLPSRLEAQNPRAFHVPEPASVVERASAASLDTTVARLTATGRPDSVRKAIRLLNRSLETGCDAGFNGYNSGTWLGLRPDVSRCIWNQDGVEGFDLAHVAAGTRSGSIYSDLVAAYFGPLRTTIATMVAASSEDGDEGSDPENEAAQESRAALQRLVNGGGNLLFTAELPLVRLNLPRLNALSVVMSGSGRATTNVQALGAAEEDSASTMAAAFNVQVNLTSNNREVRVFGFWRGEYIRGDDPLLGDTVAAPPPSTQQAGTVTRPAATGNSLAYARFSAGALLWDAVLVTWTRPMFCEECDKLGIGSQVSISFQRNTTKNGNPSGGGPN